MSRIHDVGDRRAKGRGSKARWVNGTWQARFTDPRDHRRHAVYGPTAAAAEKARDEALRDIERGLTPGDRQSVEQFCEHWLRTVAAQSLRPRSYERYAGLVRRYIIPELGSLKLAGLTPQRIAQLYTDRLAAGASPASVHYLHAVLHRALGQAVAWHLLAFNPAEHAPKPRRSRPEIHPFSPEDARALAAGMRGHPLEVLVLVALRTGMRLGELAGLQWRDLDPDAGLLHVRRELYRHHGAWLTDEPKTARRRVAAITPESVALLRRYKLQRSEQLLAVGHRLVEGDAIFSGPDGGPLDWEHFTERTFRPLLRELGLPPHRFHDLRHTTATLMLAAGVDPKTVSDTLGHSTVEMTLNVYAHSLPAMRAEAVRTLEAVLGGTNG